MRYHFIPTGMAIIYSKETEINECHEDMGKLCATDRNVNGTTAMENSLVVPQNLNIKLPHNPPIPLLGIYAYELKAENQILIYQCS